MATKFKTGDKVRFIGSKDGVLPTAYHLFGRELTIKEVNPYSSTRKSRPHYTFKELDNGHGFLYEDALESSEIFNCNPKSVLVNGMVIECVNGARFMVLNNYLIQATSCILLSYFRPDLIHMVDDAYTVNKIFYCKAPSFESIFDDVCLIWERPKPKEMTLNEIEAVLGHPVIIKSK